MPNGFIQAQQRTGNPDDEPDDSPSETSAQTAPPSEQPPHTQGHPPSDHCLHGHPLHHRLVDEANQESALALLRAAQLSDPLLQPNLVGSQPV